MEKYQNKPVNLKSIDDFKCILSKRANYIIEYLKKEKIFDKCNNFCIGINGQWGAGKTSYINILLSKFIAEKLINPTDGYIKNKDIEQEIKQNNQIILLEPWHFSDKNKLANYFLNSIESKLIKSGCLSDESKLDLEIYINILSPNGTIKSILHLINLTWSDKILSSSVIFVLLLYIAYSFKSSGVNYFINTHHILYLWILVFFSTWFINRVYNNIIKKVTLEDVKIRISQSLEKLDKKLVVIIDDIDRLSKEEIQEVFKSVKQVLDFPNIIFILSFDKTHVAHQIKEQFAYSNETSAYLYLNKIVDIYENIEINAKDTIDYMMYKIKFDVEKTIEDIRRTDNILKYESAYLVYSNRKKQLMEILDYDLYLQKLNSGKKAESDWRVTLEDLCQDLTFRDINQIVLTFLYRINKNNWIIYDFRALLLICIIEYKYPEAYKALKPIYSYNNTAGSEYLHLEEKSKEGKLEDSHFLKLIKENHKKILDLYPVLSNAFKLLINHNFLENKDSNGNKRTISAGYEDEMYNFNKYHFSNDPLKFDSYLDDFVDIYEIIVNAYKYKTKLNHDDLERLLNIHNGTQLTFYAKKDIVGEVFNNIYTPDEKNYILGNIILNYENICTSHISRLEGGCIDKILKSSEYGKNIFQLVNLTELFSDSSRNQEKTASLYNRIKLKNGTALLNLVEKGIILNDEKIVLALFRLLYFKYNNGTPGRDGGFIIGEQKRKEVIQLIKEKNPEIADDFDLFKEIIFKRNRISSRFLSWKELEPFVKNIENSDNIFLKELASDIKDRREFYADA
ncbi:MAG: hypothetical protein GY793_04215 [Proteobacteria bacterium]|nr:hypothetical protein [Pseudomonadota bacterium]